MTQGQTDARQIESLYQSSFTKKFPYADCYKVQREYPKITAALIPDLDAFFSFIAGYSSSATRMCKRPIDELKAAKRKLESSFFELYPVYRPIAEQIMSGNLPNLQESLRAADELRRYLLMLLSEILGPGEKRGHP